MSCCPLRRTVRKCAWMAKYWLLEQAATVHWEVKELEWNQTSWTTAAHVLLYKGVPWKEVEMEKKRELLVSNLKCGLDKQRRETKQSNNFKWFTETESLPVAINWHSSTKFIQSKQQLGIHGGRYNIHSSIPPKAPLWDSHIFCDVQSKFISWNSRFKFYPNCITQYIIKISCSKDSFSKPSVDRFNLDSSFVKKPHPHNLSKKWISIFCEVMRYIWKFCEQYVF